MPPESFLDSTFSKMSDVWSYGVTLWEIIMRSEPYPELSPVQAMIAVVKENLRLELPDSVPDDLRNLVASCFKEVDQRPTFSDIVNNLKKNQMEK
jgi:serine/threonine protein kinase